MMFTLFEGWFWCFFLEKKDILGYFEPRNGGMVEGGGDYGGGRGWYRRFRWALSNGKRVGRERGLSKRVGEKLKYTYGRGVDRQTPKNDFV